MSHEKSSLTSIMVLSTIAVATMSVTDVVKEVKEVNADKDKYYCSNDPVVPFLCGTGPNRALKDNICEPLELDCHNTRQTCELFAEGKCTKQD